ncbi:toxin-antitoxin system [Lactiplantibacillus pentosus]|uniref:Toxin-antitoxin system n=1 Tax=Lactiplantibacillus pentosus TaxID=1589 RepID=A0AAW8VZ25_LACPE|nr:toxin-antitoxin system [Lactiplantibacillus pentosus]AUI79276.1 toxin-antitoxin system [Lactiplantibacillus pentosus]MBO9163970.1 toxin-antitoxin system [Lactiplantibacillus pentosus]MBU7473338.1 toxin-antitoxin system [Lactiplantibacillus pentosus]MBU7528597.1 toxin-antitoxin system [Lactiplantibacillus pentosus]MCE6031817.1 toxin-antitoxin system [Lactiplantibacillus pentosus]
MKTTKTRRQGNAITLTVPESFKIGVGITVRPYLTDYGIFYEFVQDDDCLDFDENILQDLVHQGYEGQELITQFKKMKKQLPKAMDRLIEDSDDGVTMTKEEAAKAIGL